MKPQTELDAIALLHDTSHTTIEREAAVHYLAESRSPASIEALVRALLDQEFSIRWSAATALSYAGDEALAPVLHTLVSYGTSSTLREVAHHALSQNVSPQARAQVEPVLAAMKGPAADIATPQAAFRALRELEAGAP